MAYKNYKTNSRKRRKSSWLWTLSLLCFGFIVLIFAFAIIAPDRFQIIKTHLLISFYSARSSLISILCLTVLFCLFKIRFIIVNSRTFVANASGYLHSLIGFQHRFYAAKILGRSLHWSEEVHHINGKTSDNRPANLCVLTRDDHRAFHIWLSGEKRRLGHYPSITAQRHVLSKRFYGLLLG